MDKMNKLKFDVGDINSYSGEDLVLLVGCPGSKWSSIHRMLSENPKINNTDWARHREWDATITDIYGETNNMGVHRGAYWGPGNEFGKDFDKLNILNKAYILNEFMQPYTKWDGVKVIKCHWFAYHLNYISQMFPKAKILSCYAGDVESFYWWHKCGGWGIGHGGYSWYENDSRLIDKIKEENSSILKFNMDRDILFNYNTLEDMWSNLEIPATTEKTSLTRCKIAIYHGGYIGNFKELNFNK